MVFSLFGRKDKTPDARRARTPSTVRAPDAAQPSVAEQRELARRTAEKIDQIESEMIDAPVSQPATRPMPRPAPGGVAIPGMTIPPAAPAAASHDAGLEPVRTTGPLAPLDFGTSVVLGDDHGAAGGIQVSGSTLPPELEEAAILYANGQAEAAASTLKAAIVRGAPEASGRQAWAMLFDVLQARGAKAEFEAAALDYAARFEKSPPPWVEAMATATVQRRGPAPTAVPFPPRVDAGCVRLVENAQRAAAARRAVTLDFARVTETDADGAALVVGLLRELEASGRDARVLGARALFDAARSSIEPGRRDEPDTAWHLALFALRLLGEKEAFDDLAIDFCVTYEVSPPSWEALPPGLRAGTPADAAAHPPVEDGPALAGPTVTLEGSALALHGEIVGKMPAELAALHRFAANRRDVVIDCRDLRRLDFLAAGELLNEVVVLVSGGKTVLFVEPSAIVDALMTVMGIHELADVRRRRI